MLTDEQFNEIEARANAATLGPWRAKSFDESQTVILPCPDESNRHAMVGIVSIGHMRPDGENNAEFIAHAREDVPALIAEIRRLRAELEERAFAISNLMVAGGTLLDAYNGATDCKVLEQATIDLQSVIDRQLWLPEWNCLAP